jgi:hypothetical protein
MINSVVPLTIFHLIFLLLSYAFKGKSFGPYLN